MFQQTDRISPNCPLCNQIIVIQPGENIDCKVNQHIEFGCRIFKPAFSREFVKENKCIFPRCKESYYCAISCNLCKENYCPSHHIPEVHNCANLKTLILKQRAFMSSIPQSETTIYNESFYTGDEKTHVDVDFCEDISPKIKRKEKTFDFPCACSVGRCVDFIAKKEGIVNNNNVPGVKKLCLFQRNSSQPLIMQEMISHYTRNDGSHAKLRLGYCEAEDLSYCSSSSSSISSTNSSSCSSQSSSFSVSSVNIPHPSSLMMTAYFSSLFPPNNPARRRLVK